MEKESIRSVLVESGLIRKNKIDIIPLSGGVSSDIFLIDDGHNKFIFKRAREKLDVDDPWHADISRNITEQNFINYIQKHIPGCVPQILYRDVEQRFFVMEYLDRSFENWKHQLLNGVWNAQTIIKASVLLSNIHHYSRGDEQAEILFNTSANFTNLRIEPYLITTGNRHPILKEEFYNEAKRLNDCCEALVHGDFSPKNIMVRSDRVMLLDHEVAWYGDPVFDLAFFQNHLYLKTLYHFKKMNRLPDSPDIAWQMYSNITGADIMKSIEKRFGKLLLMLMLARVDGKSPVEYLNEPQKQFIRSFVYDLFEKQIFNRNQLHSMWYSKLKIFQGEN